MQNKFSKESIATCAMAVLLGFAAQARSFEFKQFKSTGSKANSEYYWMGTEKSKSSWYQVKIGGASKIDDMSEMEIRAATVFKNVKDRKTGVNDIAKFKFDPINKGKAIYFMISSGASFMVDRDNDYWYGGNDGRANKGWQLAGCVIEIWQKGKVVKHWSGAGTAGKIRLADGIPLLRINRDGRPSDTERFGRDFDNATEIFSVNQKGERVDIDDVLQPYREGADEAKGDSEKKSEKKGDSAGEAPMKNVVAQKLRQCDFLLNEKFKKNAKFYLCLFSASWCPPCRREMPRIAETYAETLKNDPDIELIHFSRDQDDEKAMAWAKEHDVKFPVVKPKGSNPLDLHTRGIPHLFIVKADGTLVEEGHPMSIFNEEKFSEIKGGGLTKGSNRQNADGDAKISENKANNGMRAKSRIAKKYTNLQTSEVDGVKWLYVDSGNSVNLVGADSSLPRDLVIPDEIDGKKVLTIEEKAFEGCEEIVSLETPSKAISIGRSAFAGCPNLESVRILSGSVRWSVFRGCPKLKSVFVGGKVRSLEYGSLAACEKLESVVIEEGLVALKYRMLLKEMSPSNPCICLPDMMVRKVGAMEHSVVVATSRS